jgi:hypothetical protein
MRTEAEILADARDGKAFPNGASFDVWSSQWCDRGAGCVHDRPDTNPPVYCPLVGVAMIYDQTPKEWHAADQRAETLSNYTCTEFEEIVVDATDDDPDESYAGPRWRPIETIQGQEGLF